MASFKIHLDDDKENCRVADKEYKTKIPKKIAKAAGKRLALQSFNNGVRQDNKRMKVGNKENVPPKEERKVKSSKKGEKPKIDSDLSKIVPEKCATSEHKDILADQLLRKPSTLAIEYWEDLWKYQKDMECLLLPKPNYMNLQPSITWNMRTILVDWLASVVDEYEMSTDSFHLAVNYLDRFLSKISVVREKFQLVGAAAMMVAGKMEDIYPPMPKEWAYLTRDTFTVRQIQKMEQLVIKVLEFKLQPPTSRTFVNKFCIEHKLDDTTMNLAMYLTELVLLEGQHYLKFKPSEIAAASVLFARFNLMKPIIWPEEMEKSSGYTVKHLSPIVQAQSVTLKQSPHKKQQAIQDKYKSPKFKRVALLKPRLIRLNFAPDESEVSSVVVGEGKEMGVKDLADGVRNV